MHEARLSQARFPHREQPLANPQPPSGRLINEAGDCRFLGRLLTFTEHRAMWTLSLNGAPRPMATVRHVVDSTGTLIISCVSQTGPGH
jgi:hypothetical protein